MEAGKRTVTSTSLLQHKSSLLPFHHLKHVGIVLQGRPPGYGRAGIDVEGFGIARQVF